MAIFRSDVAEEPVELHAEAARYRSSQPGIVTRHCFSSGSHYDPDNLGYRDLIGLDEHLLDPGAGFDWHSHRDVLILSWVVEGTLRHEDDTGRTELVAPGTVLRQSMGSGVRHTERNASDSESLRLVQLTVRGGPERPDCTTSEPPLLVPGLGLFAVLNGRTELELASGLFYVTAGSFNVIGHVLGPGDSARVLATLSLHGNGEALLWTQRGRDQAVAAPGYRSTVGSTAED